MKYMNKKMRDNNEGFTLIELIITVCILALVTAPFLSSFISANKTNLKTKNLQEATDVAQYLIEEFKASSLEKLNDNYLATTTAVAGEYVFDVSTDKIPSAYLSGYSAKITLTPAADNINNNVPVFSNVDNEKAAVIMSDFYNRDDLYTASNPGCYRVSTLDIGYSSLEPEKPYYVSVSVSYYSASGSLLEEYNNKTKIKFAEVPEVYMMYSALKSSDEIFINNSIAPSQLSGEKPNVYLVMQTSASMASINSNQVYIKESGKGYIALTLCESSNFSNLDYTNIHTNIVPSGSTSDGNLVEVTTKNSLYDMKVEIMYDGKKVGNFTSTKSCN